MNRSAEHRLGMFGNYWHNLPRRCPARRPWREAFQPGISLAKTAALGHSEITEQNAEQKATTGV